MKIHSSPIIILSRALRAWTSTLAETDQRSEERRRGCWAIRICNQAQSKRVNLRGVCTLATKLAPCTALVEILSVVGEVVPSRCYHAHERTREIEKRGRGEFWRGWWACKERVWEADRAPSVIFPLLRRTFAVGSLRKTTGSTKMPRNYALHLTPFPAYSIPSRTIAVTSSACNSVALPS